VATRRDRLLCPEIVHSSGTQKNIKIENQQKIYLLTEGRVRIGDHQRAVTHHARIQKITSRSSRFTKSILLGYGFTLGETRGHVPNRSWVIKKSFEVLLALPANIIAVSWRRVGLEHPAIRDDYIVEEEAEDNRN